MNTTHPKCLLTKVCQETEGFKGTKHEGVHVCEDGCVHHNPTHKFYLWKLSNNTVAITDYVEIKDGLVNIDQFGYVKAEFLKSAREKNFLISYAMKLGL